MLSNRDILIRILTEGDSSGAEAIGASLDQVADKASQLGKSLSLKVTAPLVGLGVVSAKFAADANESLSKMEAVFGERSAAINDWIAELRESVPATTADLQDLASGMQDLLEPMGVAADEAEAMTKGIVELAADLASFNNIPIAEALQRLRSGLVGQYEPLLKFGVALNATTVKAAALAEGIGDGKRQLTASERALVSYKMILEATSKAHGDAARTKDSDANATKFLRAESKELATQLGQALLPAITPIVSGLKDAAVAAQELDPALLKAGVAIGALAAATGPALIVTGSLIRNFRLLKTVAPGAAAGLGAFGAAVAALGVGYSLGRAIDDVTGLSDAMADLALKSTNATDGLDQALHTNLTALFKQAQAAKDVADIENARTLALAMRKDAGEALTEAMRKGDEDEIARYYRYVQQLERYLNSLDGVLERKAAQAEKESQLNELTSEGIDLQLESVAITEDQLDKQLAVTEMRKVELAILRAKISGNDAELKQMEQQKRELQLINRYKAYGFTDAEAGAMAKEEATLSAQAAAAEERRTAAKREGLRLSRETVEQERQLNEGVRRETVIGAGGERGERFFDQRGRKVDSADAYATPANQRTPQPATATSAAGTATVSTDRIDLTPVLTAVDQMTQHFQAQIDQLASRINEAGN